MHPLIDTHIHLDYSAFKDDLDSVIDRALEAGVYKIISIGSGSGGIASAENAVQLAEKYPTVYASVGIHPCDLKKEEKILASHISIIEDLAKHPKVVAIGESGLDFYWDKEGPYTAQYDGFLFQIELCKKIKKPIIVHSRNSAKACLDFLLKNFSTDLKGVFHCYGEGDVLALQIIKELDFLISFTGTITFKSNNKQREILKNIPLTHLMVETDGPFMAPEPYRGTGRAESAHVVEMAKCIAMVKGITEDEARRVTTENSERLFF